MEKLFDKIVTDITEINKSETKSLPVKIIKFNEEFGEFSAELIKMLGETYKEYDEKELKSEMADVLQCLISIYSEISKKTGITMEDVLNEILVKNEKWKSKIQDYTKNK